MKICADSFLPFLRYEHLFMLENENRYQDVISFESRLFYTVKGEGTIHVSDNIYHMKPHALLLFPPGSMYSINPSKEFPMWMYGVNFDLSQAQKNLTQPIEPLPKQEFIPGKDNTHIIQLPFLNEVTFLEDARFADLTLSNIHNEFMMKKRYFQQKINHMLAELIFDISRQISIEESCGKINLDLAQEILLFIQDNYNRPLTNKMISDAFHFHPNYLNHLMVQYTGRSLHNYLLMYRLSVALNLLQKTDRPISEISQSVGFPNANYFARYFKKTYGCTPRECRNYTPITPQKP